MINTYLVKRISLILGIGLLMIISLMFFASSDDKSSNKKSTTDVHRIEVHFYNGRVDTITAKGDVELGWMYGDWCLEDEETVLARGVQYINVIR